jgi:hypothetical protein
LVDLLRHIATAKREPVAAPMQRFPRFETLIDIVQCVE